ncbi:MAG: hypothetical protein FJ090_07745, partial [Deltaproteobacteria bacterium]|nr:hypothetical protein [Deltaproteobacteria bacterium]
MAVLLQNVALDDRDATVIAAELLSLPVASVRAAEVVRRSLDARARVPSWRGNLRVDVDDESAV